MSTVIYDFECPTHGYFEAFCDNREDNDHQPCPACGKPAEWRPSTTGLKVPLAVAAVHGGVDAAPHRLALDTRELGEGMPISEWRAKREAAWRQHDANDPKHRELAEATDRVANKKIGVVRDRPDQKRSKLARAMAWVKGES